MKILEAKKVYNSLIVLADFLDMTEQQIANNVSFLDDKKFKKIKEAVTLVNDWNTKSIKEKCKIMGYSYQETKNGKEVSVVLNN